MEELDEEAVIEHGSVKESLLYIGTIMRLFTDVKYINLHTIGTVAMKSVFKGEGMSSTIQSHIRQSLYIRNLHLCSNACS